MASMTIVIYLPWLVCLIGFILLLVAKARWDRVGEIMFGAGLLSALLTLGNTLHLGIH